MDEASALRKIMVFTAGETENILCVIVALKFRRSTSIVQVLCLVGGTQVREADD